MVAAAMAATASMIGFARSVAVNVAVAPAATSMPTPTASIAAGSKEIAAKTPAPTSAAPNNLTLFAMLSNPAAASAVIIPVLTISALTPVNAPIRPDVALAVFVNHFSNPVWSEIWMIAPSIVLPTCFSAVSRLLFITSATLAVVPPADCSVLVNSVILSLSLISASAPALASSRKNFIWSEAVMFAFASVFSTGTSPRVLTLTSETFSP